jgi:oligopeptide transport system ATP-binding protein
LLAVRELFTQFNTERGVVKAVDGVSFDVAAGETLGIVGESGCGKSVTALSLVRLVPEPAGCIVSGEVAFEGVDLLQMPADGLRRIRGGRIGFVFQDPMTSLNPSLTIGYQIAETVRTHLGLSEAAAMDRAVELLDQVGIPQAGARVRDYPHQFSGGMRQRVMIAIAVACGPKLLIADEPTTALDVTVQAQILELIRSMTERSGAAVILITHDLGVAAGLCDRISVMYAGRFVESGLIDDVFDHPAMPYTGGLINSVPRLDRELDGRLHTIPGMPPDLVQGHEGCRFGPRCAHARDVCFSAEPALTERPGSRHVARCWGTERTGWIS